MERVQAAFEPRLSAGAYRFAERPLVALRAEGG
jgi:hypothetical protein